jgi:hypothetical protein
MAKTYCVNKSKKELFYTKDYPQDTFLRFPFELFWSSMFLNIIKNFKKVTW